MADSLIFADEHVHMRANCRKAIRDARIASYWYAGICLAIALLCIGLMYYEGFDEDESITAWVFGVNGLLFVGLGLLSLRSPRTSFLFGMALGLLWLAGEVTAAVMPDDIEVRVFFGIFALLQATLAAFFIRGIIFAGRLSNLPVVVAV